MLLWWQMRGDWPGYSNDTTISHAAPASHRAHVEESAPGAALAALEARGLVSEALAYEDDWVQLEGLGAAQGYLGRLGAAGAEFEVSKVFAACRQYE